MKHESLEKNATLLLIFSFLVVTIDITYAVMLGMDDKGNVGAVDDAGHHIDAFGV